MTIAGAGGLSSPAKADPLRLRADALAEAQGTSSPAGLVVLQGEDAMRPWVAAEALVWTGARTDTPSATGDVLVLAVRLREPHGYAEARAGRFVLATGAVHPVQIDGVHVIARAPWGSRVETFGGLPVVPRFGARSYDWLAGGRVAQTVGGALTFGASYVQRREYGEVSNEEVGIDFAAAPAPWVDVAGFGAYDVTNPGLAEARASAAVRWNDWRFELFGSQISPGRLLPATSLFSVLGDVPSQTIGTTARWRAAPHLDVLASGAGEDVAGGSGAMGGCGRRSGSTTGVAAASDSKCDAWASPARSGRGCVPLARSRSARVFAIPPRSRSLRPTTPTGKASRGRGVYRRCRGGPMTAGPWPARWRRLRRRSGATRRTRSCTCRMP